MADLILSVSVSYVQSSGQYTCKATQVLDSRFKLLSGTLVQLPIEESLERVKLEDALIGTAVRILEIIVFNGLEFVFGELHDVEPCFPRI